MRKIRLKLLQLCYDLILNDDSIFAGGFVVRNYFGKNKEFIKHLLTTLENADLETNQEIQVRDYTLNILYRLYNRSTPEKR